MKVAFLIILAVFVSCSKSGNNKNSKDLQGSKDSQVSLVNELNQIKGRTFQSSHALTAADLDYLLSQEVITEAEHAELMQLAQN